MEQVWTEEKWKDIFESAFNMCSFQSINQIKIEFTVAELRDLTMKMIKLKHYEEQFEKDRDIEC